VRKFTFYTVGYVFFFILTLFSSSSVSYGVDYFTDNFDNLDIPGKWDFVQGSGNYADTWYVVGGKLYGEIGYEGSSYLFSKVGGTLSEYVVELDVINRNGVDQNILLGVNEERDKYFVVNLRYRDPNWTDSNMVRLWYYDRGSYSLLAEVEAYETDPCLTLSKEEIHKIEVKYVEGNISLDFDNIAVFSVSVDNLELMSNSGVGLMNWSGSYRYGNVVNLFDNLKIRSIDHNLPFPLLKIFIIPGLGASWNERAMVFGDKVDDGDWRMTPFVKNYDGLLAALESKGLKRDIDYFVWNYDWRRPIADIADSLDQFIDDKTDESSKIGLVGHSLGGLVAREWGQKHTGDGRVEKIITVGSPHLGVTKAYKAWNGAVVSDKFDFSTIALKIMLMLQRRNFETDVAVVRNYAPVLKDLLPVFDFAKINGQTVLVGGMAVKNDYLLTANLTVSELFPILEAVAAKGTPTEEWLNLGKRSVYDQAFGIWPDGRWTGSVSGEGDGTVLLKSAKFDSDNYWQIESDHGMMVDKSKEKIFEYLGLNYDEEIEGIADDWADKKVFYLGSPARMSVTCEGATEVGDETGFIVLEDDAKECEVRLRGERDGIYHLVLGNVADENSWSYFEDEIKAGETRTMVLSADGNLVGESSKDYLLGLMGREMRALADEGYGGDQSLNQAIVRLAAGEAKPILDSMMAFRKQSRETKRSGVVLSYVEKLLVWENGGGSQKVAWQEMFRAWRLKNLADYNGDAKSRWKIYPSTFASVNYLLMDRLLTEAQAAYKKSDWPQTIAKSIIASKLSEQIW